MAELEPGSFLRTKKRLSVGTERGDYHRCFRPNHAEETAMAAEKTIHIRISGRVAKKIAVLANQEGRKLGEMAQILLEDALALRETIRSQSGMRAKNRNVK